MVKECNDVTCVTTYFVYVTSIHDGYVFYNLMLLS